MRLEDVEVVDESGTVIPVTDVRIENVAWPFADRMGRPVTARTSCVIRGRLGSKMTIRRLGGEVLGRFVFTGVGASSDQDARFIIHGIHFSDEAR